VDYGGFYCKRTPTDVDLPALDCDKAISVSLRYEEKLPDGQAGGLLRTNTRPTLNILLLLHACLYEDSPSG
jgi:hypothetical protein